MMKNNKSRTSTQTAAIILDHEEEEDAQNCWLTGLSRLSWSTAELFNAPVEARIRTGFSSKFFVIFFQQRDRASGDAVH